MTIFIWYTYAMILNLRNLFSIAKSEILIFMFILQRSLLLRKKNTFFILALIICFLTIFWYIFFFRTQTLIINSTIPRSSKPATFYWLNLNLPVSESTSSQKWSVRNFQILGSQHPHYMPVLTRNSLQASNSHMTFEHVYA